MDEDRQPERPGRDREEGPELPDFDLPPWGSGGAPAFAQPEAPEPAQVSDTGVIVVTADRLDGATRMLGLVAGEASHPVEDDVPARAVAIARTAAMERLVEQAAAMGARGVVAARFAIDLSKRLATVLVTGTAVA